MTDAVRSTTLEELITRVAFRLGDAVLLESTDAGSTVTFIDVINIPVGNEDLTRRQMVITSGTYRGQVKSIVACSHAQHMVTFDPATAGSVPAAVTAVVINKRGMGYTYPEYKRAINMAIEDAYPIYRELIAASTSTFNSATGTLTIPSTINEVYAVEWQDEEGQWWPIETAEHRSYPGWQVDQYANQIIVNDLDLRANIDGMSVRVLGEGKPGQLSAYSDTTKINPEWLTARACYHLCLMGLDRDITGLRSKQVLTFQAEAENRMTLIRTRRQPSSAPSRIS